MNSKNLARLKPLEKTIIFNLKNFQMKVKHFCR